MSKLMLINVTEGEESRIAITEDGRLEELYMERTSAESHVGNIYKGRITNVEPSIQAAFVDFGLEKNGFLHISDVQPNYFRNGAASREDIGRKTGRRDRPPIQDCLRRGQEVLVQVTKEGIGTKGPTLSTYVSIPGRYLVLMPGMNKTGVSRKIEDEDARRKLRRLLDQLRPPENMGFIIRTAGIGRTGEDLQHDLDYLVRIWKTIERKMRGTRAPCELYQESDLVIRTIRDIYTSETQRVIVDDPKVARRVYDFLSVAMPEAAPRVELYESAVPLFHKYGVEREIEAVHSRVVKLAGGGSLVIDQTEALVAIDVNSGKFRDPDSAEQTAFQINKIAAREIARQLRLRDLGGVIVCDFIDMIEERHQRGVEAVLAESMGRDRARSRALRMSRFGIVEMTRQRLRPSLQKSVNLTCPACAGTGMIKSPESVCLDAVRLVQLAVHRETVRAIEVHCGIEAAEFLNNKRRKTLADLETATGKRIIAKVDPKMPSGKVELRCFDARGVEVRFDPEMAVGTAPVRLARVEEIVRREEAERGRDTDEDDLDAHGDGAGEPAFDEVDDRPSARSSRESRDVRPGRGTGERTDRGDRGERGERTDRPVRGERGDRTERADRDDSRRPVRVRETDDRDAAPEHRIPDDRPGLVRREPPAARPGDALRGADAPRGRGTDARRDDRRDGPDPRGEARDPRAPRDGRDGRDGRDERGGRTGRGPRDDQSRSDAARPAARSGEVAAPTRAPARDAVPTRVPDEAPEGDFAFGLIPGEDDSAPRGRAPVIDDRIDEPAGDAVAAGGPVSSDDAGGSDFEGHDEPSTPEDEVRTGLTFEDAPEPMDLGGAGADDDTVGAADRAAAREEIDQDEVEESGFAGRGVADGDVAPAAVGGADEEPSAHENDAEVAPAGPVVGAGVAVVAPVPADAAESEDGPAEGAPGEDPDGDAPRGRRRRRRRRGRGGEWDGPEAGPDGEGAPAAEAATAPAVAPAPARRGLEPADAVVPARAATSTKWVVTPPPAAGAATASDRRHGRPRGGAEPSPAPAEVADVTFGSDPAKDPARQVSKPVSSRPKTAAIQFVEEAPPAEFGSGL